MYGRRVGDMPQAAPTSQTQFGAGTLYPNSVKAPFRNYPFNIDGPWPWTLIGGPQLRQAPSLHNIFNSVPIVIVRRVPNPATNQKSLIDRIVSLRPQLPASLQSALGGTS